MGSNHLTRRQYGIAAVGFGAAIAGCAGGSNGEGADDEADDGDEPEDESGDDEREEETSDETTGEEDFGSAGTLAIFLENEGGNPVSDGVEVHVMHDEESVGAITEDVVDGEVELELTEAGSYTVRAESLEDAFEPVEEGVDVDGDEEVTLVLEGAGGDGDEGGEDGEDDGDESGEDEDGGDDE